MQGEDLASVLVDHVQPRKSVHDEDAVAQRCYETSDGRWYKTSCNCVRVLFRSFDWFDQADLA